MNRWIQSIQGRIIALMLLTFTIVVAVSMVFIQHKSLYELDEMLDANLAQSARFVYSLLHHQIEQGDADESQMIIRSFLAMQPGDEELSSLSTTQAHYAAYERKIFLQLDSPDGVVLFNSHSQPLLQPGDDRQGYFRIRDNDTLWRVYGLHDLETGYRFFMGQSDDYRHEINEEVSEDILKPLAIFSPFLVLIIGWGVSRGLAPLRRLSREIAERDPSRLDPIELQEGSRELQPLVRSLNGLMLQLDDALAHERRFTADASHELRTPLAGVRAQLGVLQGARNDTERLEALQALDVATIRMTRLVDELLALARLDSGKLELEWQPLDVRERVAELISEQALVAINRGVELELEAPRELMVETVASLFDLAFNNLLSNAIKHSPEGGTVLVSLRSTDTTVVCQVDDEGAGIPAGDLQRVFERFFQSGDKSAEGVGLGLSIAGRAADLCGIRIALKNRDYGGLSATLTLKKTVAGQPTALV